MTTIFALPKPFEAHAGIIQANAIRSWANLQPSCEILLIGDEPGTKEMADEIKAAHIPDVKRNQWGTPLISDIFNSAHRAASYPTMCYINSDIILPGNFTTQISRISLNDFLCVGRRWNTNVREYIDYHDRDWEEKLQEKVHKQGRLFLWSALDYFVFPKHLYTEVPPFAVGRPSWDNWMIYHARICDIPVIDATKSILAVHQSHGYSHISSNERKIAEKNDNIKLTGGAEHFFHAGHATLVLTQKGLKPALSPIYLYFRLSSLIVQKKWLKFLHPLIKAVNKTLRLLYYLLLKHRLPPKPISEQ